ncbi:cell wall metabolism sensor histidine kinase WalK [Microaerobacter geothermalis]|uniref:cell wall metabolism sensor histidine kinase WalK n=1 Tax=Microaerobacter geothermalis TaxID=674972 RepID=UPI001F2900DA|nr:cell wall metabolism sensor histidine kinase WalK [Microaerobacter geothermalis]MCF6094650.1 cell wall metabolism sensor histidine kinase WalK [Microaerobacter geothermalis]
MSFANLRIFASIQWKLLVIYILLILIAMQLIGAYFIRALESYYVKNFSDTINTQANLLAFNLQRYFEGEHEWTNNEKMKLVQEDINHLVNNLVAIKGAEVQIVDQNGIIISSTQKEKELIGQKNTLIEVYHALLGTKSEEVKIDPVTGYRVKVLAVPIKRDNQVLGAVYLMASMEETYETIKQINRILATGTGVALLITSFLGIFLSKTITTPVKEITRQASDMAEGNFRNRVKVYGDDEIGQLGAAFNYLGERLTEALTQNEEEREKLSSIISNMSDGVIAEDDSEHIILINEKAQWLLGIGENEWINKSINDLLKLPDEDEFGPFTEKDNSFLLELGSSPDEIKNVRVIFSSIKRSGQRVGKIAVLQDMTEQVKLEVERKEFVANVSHELRTPLTTIKSYLEALEDGAVQDEQLAPKFFRVLQMETDRMIRLVNDLLQLAKMDSRQVQLSYQDTEMNLFLQDTIDRFSVQAKNKGITLKLVSPREIPNLRIDKDQMIQVMDNILSNAIKNTPQGGSITINASVKNNGFFVIDVIDNGIGIPKKELNKIFDRFYRVDKARSRNMGGTGLGLSIAREITKLHGGMISLDSELNKGTKVTVALPLNRESVVS